MVVPPTLCDPLERCYRVFESVERPREMLASPYGSEDIAERVLSAPARELGDDAIGPYAGSAILTVGTSADYRYFLPRILELSVTSGAWIGGNAPVVAERLLRSDWLTWSSHQQSAVRDFFDDAYCWSIGASNEEPAEADLWLCANILIGSDPARLLNRWRSNSSPWAAYRLADLRCAWADFHERGERLPFWEGVADGMWNAMVTWLLDPSTEHQIKAALSEIDNEDRWQLDRALAVIQNEVRH